LWNENDGRLMDGFNRLFAPTTKFVKEKLGIISGPVVVNCYDDDVITRNIRSLAAQGFGIDLDDFGTGHAAIANIRRFAVNRIKIDRSFITKIDSDPEQQVLTSAIIGMAESLGLETLAEGVETVAEHSRLAQMGCRYIQGFGIARPMPFEDTIAWLHKHRDKLAKGQGAVRKAG